MAAIMREEKQETANALNSLIPYLASTEWYRLWSSALIEGKGEEDAVKIASTGCGIRAKGFSRTAVGDGVAEPLILSVPVVGGATRLKRLPGEDPVVSDHGDWTRSHAATLDTIYGRTPFYPHIGGTLRQLLCNAPGTRLFELNSHIHRSICRMLRIPEILEDLRIGFRNNPQRFSDIRHDLGKEIPNDKNLSVLGPLSILGPDLIFYLAAPDSE